MLGLKLIFTAIIGLAAFLSDSRAFADEPASEIEPSTETTMTAAEQCLEQEGQTLNRQEVLALAQNCDAVIWYSPISDDYEPEAVKWHMERISNALREGPELNVVAIQGSPREAYALAIRGQSVIEGFDLHNVAEYTFGDIGAAIIVDFRDNPPEQP